MSYRLGELFGTFCLTYRKTILVLIAAVTLLTGSQLLHIRFDNSLDNWFLRDDPVLAAHRHFTDEFGSDELIVIGLEADDVFAPEVLRRIDRITRAVAQAPSVEKVFSLTNIEAVDGQDGTLEVGDLVEFPLDEAALADLRARALANETYVGNVVNTDGTFATIIARLPFRLDEVDYKVEAVQAIEKILAGEDGVRFYVGGMSVLNVRFLQMSERDMPLVTAIMSGLLLVILWLLFRSPTGVLVPSTAVGIATIWAIGLIFLLGRRLTVVSEALPPLLLAVGVADSMHILIDYQVRVRAGRSREQALREVYRYLTWPCMLTSLTTCVGMLSLLVSQMRGVREFGLYSAIGVFGAFFLSMTLVPIALSYLPAPRAADARGPASAAAGASEKVLEWIDRVARARHGRILAGAGILAALSLTLAFRIHTDSGMLEFFPEGHPFKTATRTIEDRLAGNSMMEIVIDTGETDGVKDPATLQRIADLQAYLAADPDVSATHAVTAVLKDLRRAFFDGDQTQYRLPETREEAAQYLFLYELSKPDGDIYEYVDYDYRRARVSTRVNSENSNIMGRVKERARAYMDTHFPPGMTATLTGNAVLHENMDDYIRESLIFAFGLALILIYGIFAVVLRSPLLGVVAMVPNVVPIVVCLGVMGAVGIPLDASTVMAVPIMIGLAVDDTIHFMTHTRQELERGSGLNLALWRTTVHTGRALTFTTVTLAAAFVTMLFGTFVGMTHFAILCLITLAVALPADMFLLPAVLRVYAHYRRPDWLTKHDTVLGMQIGAVAPEERIDFRRAPQPQEGAAWSPEHKGQPRNRGDAP